MRKYYKCRKRKTFNPYIVFILIIVGLLTMSVGYAISTDKLTIKGFANARYEIYHITYELYGGTNPENVVSEFTIVDETCPLPIPTRTGYTFKGWFDNSDFVGNSISTTEGFNDNITLYANWRKVVNSEVAYDSPGVHVFDGTNYIDTGVYLYSEENVNKNFMMSFNIVEIAEGNTNHAALMNSMNEREDPWPGHVVKIAQRVGMKPYFESNSNTDGEGNVIIPSTVSNIRIFRINNYMYYSFDGGNLIKINDYNGFSDPFDIPVYFGASNDGFGNVYRYFKGTLSDLYVAFLDDDVKVDDFNPPEQQFITKYQHLGQYTFDGSTDYINTGLDLFSEENIGKDFEVSFNIDEIVDGYVNQAVLVNMKNERINTYPGFVYRLYVGDKTVKLEGKGGTGSGVSNKQTDVHSVKISRIDGVIYISINEGEPKKTFDYSKFKNYFDVPLTIGASLDSSGNPFRYFKGTLSNIVVKVKE